MRILHFYKSYLPDSIGGVEQVIFQIAKGCANKIDSVDVLTLNTKNSSDIIMLENHNVYRCHSNFEIASTPFALSALRRFSQLAKEADIIHYHFPYPFADLLHFILRIKKPAVVTYHSDIVKQKWLLKLYKPLMCWFLRNVTHIVSTSPNYLKTSEVLSRFRHKTSVIPIGLDKDNYPVATAEKINYWRDKLGTRFFLFIGVLRYYKGLHILIDAIKDAEYPVIIVGAGPIEVELKKHADDAGVSNIHFLGFLPDEDKVALLDLCYAVVFPSHLRSEAFGVSLLEGAMYGKPLISSEIGTGTTYINIDKETGLVVPPDNPAALRKAMDYLWEHPDKALKMGENAAQRYNTLFTADQMVKSYLELYKRLINGYSVSDVK